MRQRSTSHRISIALLTAITVVSGCHRFASPAKLAFDEAYNETLITQAGADSPASETTAEKLITQAAFTEPIISGASGPWMLTLSEAVQIALSNTTVIRRNADFLSRGNVLLADPEQAASNLDPAIDGSGISFGNRGVQAALSDFDFQLSGNLIWSRDEEFQNTPLANGITAGTEQVTEGADVDFALSKTFRNGGTLAWTQTIDYEGTNAPAALFPSTYSGATLLQYSLPLWAGRGREFTDIAGPASLIAPRVFSVDQGVLISAINDEVSQIEFAQAVDALIKDVVDAYWDLALARSRWEANQESLSRLKEIRDRRQTDVDAGRADSSELAEAESAYQSTVAQTFELELALEQSELALQRMLNLPSGSSSQLVPIDPAPEELAMPDYSSIVGRALSCRSEIQRTEWRIRSLHLQRKAAMSLAKPRVDFQAGYQVNAFGDRLASSRSFPSGIDSYWSSLNHGNQTGWNVGFTFSAPLGFRQERSLVQNLELQIAKIQAALAAQRSEITYEVDDAIEQVNKWQQIRDGYTKALNAAQDRVDAVEANFEADRANLTQLLEARNALVQSQNNLDRARFEFAKAVAELRYRSGQIATSQGIGVEFVTDNAANSSVSNAG